MTITINGTTGIAGVEGSAAIPAVQGVDTNTGIFYDSETVGIATGGSERVRVASSGQIGIAGANYGTSGQVLTSGGAAAAPSWTTITSTGRLLRAPQVLTSGTSYTTPAGCTAIYVEAVGGGAGGQGSTNSQGGGGGGAYCAKYFTVTASTAYTYAIGAGGAATPTAGGSTTFTVGATTITAGGGAIGTDDGGVGGTATNGDLNARGGRGGWGRQIATSPVVNIYGAGGNSYFGGGGGTGSTTATNSALGYGGGGGGAASTGGTGFQGIIRIWEYS